jgi:hypothetical protein
MFIPKQISEKNLSKVKQYFKNNNLEFIIEIKNEFNSRNKDIRKQKDVYGPDLLDLYSLHKTVVDYKRVSALEYGTGWSSLVILDALIKNFNKYKNNKFQRILKPFNLHIIDDSELYLNNTKKNIAKFLGEECLAFANFHHSEVQMCYFKNMYATEYKNHFLFNPDFIYIDGPHQFSTKGKICNFTVNHKELMPMMCDVLKFEHFICPGTICIIDGRSANASFMKLNFQRNWCHSYNKTNEQHFFYLNEKSLGHINDKLLRFYFSKKK